MVISSDIDGESLVAFRSRSNPAHVGVLDRHCPRSGADLAGGNVCNDRLVCPFHHRDFGADGQVLRLPYSDAPMKSTLRARQWHVTGFHRVNCVYIDKDPAARGPAPLQTTTARWR
jgi:3-ketosteroid 9alpha-monooxygenase subunit A